MSERIDHASRARFMLEGLHDYQGEQGITDEVMTTVAIEAQTLATLALVDQQRIANLIAYLPYEDGDKESWVEIEAALGLTAGQEGEER